MRSQGFVIDKEMINTDAFFFGLPRSAQLLYYDLAMRADKDGTVQMGRAFVRAYGLRGDLFALVEKGYVVFNDKNYLVLQHWPKEDIIPNVDWSEMNV